MKRAYLTVILSVFVVSCFLLFLCSGTSLAESEEPTATSEETPTAGKMKSSPVKPRLPSQPEVGHKLRPSPPQGPDLVISKVEDVPDEITGTDESDRVFYPTITVKNIGNETVMFPPGFWLIGGPNHDPDIQSSKITKSDGSWRKIDPGDTITETLAGNIKCFKGSQLEVEFQVDPQNRVEETNEVNNSWKNSVANLAVPDQDKLPDLVVDAITFSPSEPDRYTKVSVWVNIVNIGDGPAIFCGNGILFMSDVDPCGGGGRGGAKVVKAGEKLRINSGGIVQPALGTCMLEKGCYRVTVTVDPYNVIPESNETNNTRIGYLSIEDGRCPALIQDRAVRDTQPVPKRTKPRIPVE